jgi:hypothetical protein
MPDVEGIADGQHHIADAQAVAAAEGDHRQGVVGRNAQHRQVGFRV